MASDVTRWACSNCGDFAGDCASICPRCLRESALRAEIERLRMEAGRQQARCAVFMSAMAWLARNGHQERAQQWVKRADDAAADVRPEDFVVAKV